MLIRFTRYAAVALFAAPILANAQLSVPPAIYQPADVSKAQIEPALVLSSDAPARSIVLATPSDAEREALTPKLATTAGKDGVTLKRRRAIGFARQVPSAEKSYRLSDLIWSPTAGGTQAAHIILTSPGAAAIRIGLVLADVPTTLEMRFRGAGASAQAFGPYPADVARETIYWSPVLEGETGVVELTLPAGVSPGTGTVSLPMISHLVVAGNALRQADPLNEIGTSGTCEVDVACVSTTLRQQAASAINAVARMVLTDQGQTVICSGTLLNDSTTSLTPYFFTANHCLDDDDADAAASKGRPAAVAATINTYWFFQTSVCGQDTANNVNFALVAGGAKLLGRSVDYDWTLLRLNNPPPTGATLASWNAAVLSAIGTAAIGIHHPEGDLKKISQGTTQGLQAFNDGSTFVTMQWTQGVTEPGSSGSGLFTFNASQNYYEFRGGLFGGDSACDARHKSSIDKYSRFDVALPMLKQYLTPNAANPTNETLVVEYYYSVLDDYFITPSPAEIQALDSGAFPGWVRTGLTFLAYSDLTAAPVGVNPVCRFYVTPQVGDSHFYSADPQECAAAATGPQFVGTWVQESTALFYIQLPNRTTGACPANTRPIFRFLNNANGLHHRFTAEVDVRNSIIQDGGWTQEGYGSGSTKSVMCSPTS